MAPRVHQPGGANAGSVFANPPGDSAGRIIDALGPQGAPGRRRDGVARSTPTSSRPSRRHRRRRPPARAGGPSPRARRHRRSSWCPSCGWSASTRRPTSPGTRAHAERRVERAVSPASAPSPVACVVVVLLRARRPRRGWRLGRRCSTSITWWWRATSTVSTDEILAASGVAPGDPMVWLDPAGAAPSTSRRCRGSAPRSWRASGPTPCASRSASGCPWRGSTRGTGAPWSSTAPGARSSVDAGRAGRASRSCSTSRPRRSAPSISPVGGAWLAGHLTTERARDRALHHGGRPAGDAGGDVGPGGPVRSARPGEPTRCAPRSRCWRSRASSSATYIDVSAPSTPVAG